MIEQIATEFGIHPMTPAKWMRQAVIDDGAKPCPAVPNRSSFVICADEIVCCKRSTSCACPAYLPQARANALFDAHRDDSEFGCSDNH